MSQGQEGSQSTTSALDSILARTGLGSLSIEDVSEIMSPLIPSYFARLASPFSMAGTELRLPGLKERGISRPFLLENTTEEKKGAKWVKLTTLTRFELGR